MSMDYLGNPGNEPVSQESLNWYPESPESEDIDMVIELLQQYDKQNLGITYNGKSVRYGQVAAMLEWLLHERHDS